MNDLKFALRQLLKNPGFTVHPPSRLLRNYEGRAVAVLTLAFGQMISRSDRPRKVKFLFGTPPPDGQTGRHCPNHRAHSLRLRVEVWVTKHAADKVRCFILPDRQDHQTVSGVTERTRGEAQITREERRTRKCQQKGKDSHIGHALATQIKTDLPNGNIPASQQLALALQNVFIKEVHVPRSHSEFVSVFTERLPGRADRLGDGFLGDATAPFLNDAFPGHPRRDLLEHIRHENPRASKRRLPVANLRIRDDVTANDFLFHSAAINTPNSPFRQRSELPSGCKTPTDSTS